MCLLHDLSYEESENLFLSRAELLGLSRVLGDHVVDESVDGRGVGDLSKPSVGDYGIRSPSRSQTASNTSLAIFAESVPSTVRNMMVARSFGSIGQDVMVSLSRCSAAVRSPTTQLAASRGCPDAVATAS